MNSAFWIVRLDHKDPRSPELMDQLLRQATKGSKVYICPLSESDGRDLARGMIDGRYISQPEWQGKAVSS